MENQILNFTMRKSSLLSLVILVLLGSGFIFETAGITSEKRGLSNQGVALLSEEWPKEIVGADGSVIIYQPQIERFNGNELDARFAVAVKMNANDGAPVFGAIWGPHFRGGGRARSPDGR